jgi:hypothetical protein
MLIQSLLRHWGKLSFGLVLSLAVSAAEPISAKSGRVPVPHPPEAKTIVSDAQKCVEPTENIRRFHGRYLKHQRDDTMHRGIRTTQHSLVECIDCHVTPDSAGNYPSIKTSEHFCRSCHSYAAVSIDCFECHASQPE